MSVHVEMTSADATVVATDAGPADDVPGLPRLATGVEPVGELRDSAFAEQQWLLVRNGKFIQVTELLYRIAEQANGARTIDEIAAAVSESTPWLVTPDQIRQLIRTRLMPLGLIPRADGS